MGLMNMKGTSFPEEEEAWDEMDDGEPSSTTTAAMGINRSRSLFIHSCHFYLLRFPLPLSLLQQCNVLVWQKQNASFDYFILFWDYLTHHATL